MPPSLVDRLEKECMHGEIVAADGVRLWSAWFDRSRAEEILAEKYRVKDFGDGWIPCSTPEGAINAANNGNLVEISRIELQRLSEIEEMMRSATHQVTQVYGQEVSFGKVLEDFCEVERKLGDAAMLLRMFAIKKDYFEPLQVKVRDWLARNNLGGSCARNVDPAPAFLSPTYDRADTEPKTCIHDVPLDTECGWCKQCTEEVK